MLKVRNQCMRCHSGWVKLAFNGDMLSANGAIHVCCEVPLGDFETETFNDGCVAVWAICVFGCVTSNVAKIYIVLSLFLLQSRRLSPKSSTLVACRFSHFVFWMEP